MSALFLAIPLTIFVLFVLPIWLWLHYSNRSGRSELSPLDIHVRGYLLLLTKVDILGVYISTKPPLPLMI